MQKATSRLGATVFSTIFQSRFSSLNRPPHCCSRDLAGEIGGLPRIRTAFSPGKGRDFTVKVCNPGRKRHEDGVEPPQPGL